MQEVRGFATTSAEQEYGGHLHAGSKPSLSR